MHQTVVDFWHAEGLGASLQHYKSSSLHNLLIQSCRAMKKKMKKKKEKKRSKNAKHKHAGPGTPSL